MYKTTKKCVSYRLVYLLACALLLAAGASCWGAEYPVKATVTTHHTLTIQGKSLSYTTDAGFLPLIDPNGVVHAQIFSMTYRLDRPKGAPTRPLVFAWNGGPGSSSAMVHIGLMGPKIAKDLKGYAKFSDKIEFVDNPFTWLQFADLVFVDPVYTGYSYATTPEYQKAFLSSQGDELSLAEFIRVYLEAHDMEHAPILLAGESYGTFRAVGVAHTLAQHGLLVKAVILFSCMLQEGGAPGDALMRSINILPTYTAAAWAQGRLTSDLQQSLEKAIAASETFARNQYLQLLIAGDAASDEQHNAVAKQLEALTGAPAESWKKHSFQMSVGDFAKEASGDKNKYIANYDTRLLGDAKPDAFYDVATDPSLSANGIDVGIVQYIRSELQFRTEAFYNGPFGSRWPYPYSSRGQWGTWNDQAPSNSESRTKDLKETMQLNPAMRIFVASGYFDFSTPFDITRSAFDHSGLSVEEHNRVQLKNYYGGHMMYLDNAVRPILYNDVSGFVAKALEEGTGK